MVRAEVLAARDFLESAHILGVLIIRVAAGKEEGCESEVEDAFHCVVVGGRTNVRIPGGSSKESRRRYGALLAQVLPFLGAGEVLAWGPAPQIGLIRLPVAQVYTLFSHLRQEPSVPAPATPNTCVIPCNPKFAAHGDVALRGLGGVLRCAVRPNCLAAHGDVPQRVVEGHVGCSANFGLGETGRNRHCPSRRKCLSSHNKHRIL